MLFYFQLPSAFLVSSYNKASDQSWVHYGCNVDLNDVLFQHAFLVLSEACVHVVQVCYEYCNQLEGKLPFSIQKHF